MAVTIMHIYEAYVLITTYCADQNIPFYALLSAVPDRLILECWTIAASVPALWAIFSEDEPAWVTALLVVPQGTLLLITASGAYHAFLNGVYHNFDPGCREFIGADQLMRASAPVLYTFAVTDKIREAAFNSLIKRYYRNRQ